MKYDKKLVEAKWYPYKDDKKVKVRCPRFSTVVIGQNVMTNLVPMLVGSYMDALVDWSGFKDGKDKMTKCEEEAKLFMYDYDQEFRGFMIELIAEIEGKVSLDLKN